jgi:hypothetical protein
LEKYGGFLTKPGLFFSISVKNSVQTVVKSFRLYMKKGEYHYGRDERNHLGKMEQYRRFLEKTA